MPASAILHVHVQNLANNWPACARLAKWHRNGRIYLLQIFQKYKFGIIIVSAKQFGVELNTLLKFVIYNAMQETRVRIQMSDKK